MGKFFTISGPIRQVAQDAIDNLIDELGKTCKLVYPPRMSACNNCVYDPIGKKSANRWLTGGPMPFAHGTTCPLCSGTGQHAHEVTVDIKMLIAWSPSHFFLKAPAGVQIPAGTVQTKGYQTDLEKVLKAREMILQPAQQHLRWRFILDGEPTDPGNIIPDRYFVVQWKRSG